MATDKIGLSEEVIKLNTAWVPAYNPFFRALVEKGLKTLKHTAVTGTVKTKETNVLGNARAEVIDPQDTEVKHAKSGYSSKTFNKYMLGIKYIQSVFQDVTDVQRCADQILEENLKKFDEDAFTGAPTQAGVLRNNGFYASTDPNFVTQTAGSLSSSASLNQLKAFFDSLLNDSEGYVGNSSKILGLTGGLAAFLGKFQDGQVVSYAEAIRNAYTAEGRDVSFVRIPNNLTADNAVLVMAPSLITFDYIELPYISAKDVNKEDDYEYIKEIHGSSRVNVEQLGAIIKKPVTLA